MKSNSRHRKAIIKLSRYDALGGRSKREFVVELKRVLTGRAEEAYLFGSITSQDFCPGSDVDLIVVAESTRPFVERFKDFNDVLDMVLPLDLLVYTPNEFAEIRRQPKVGFWKSVFKQMERVI
jgi:uncharacterized protein